MSKVKDVSEWLEYLMDNRAATEALCITTPTTTCSFLAIQPSQACSQGWTWTPAQKWRRAQFRLLKLELTATASWARTLGLTWPCLKRGCTSSTRKTSRLTAWPSPRWTQSISASSGPRWRTRTWTRTANASSSAPSCTALDLTGRAPQRRRSFMICTRRKRSRSLWHFTTSTATPACSTITRPTKNSMPGTLATWSPSMSISAHNTTRPDIELTLPRRSLLCLLNSEQFQFSFYLTFYHLFAFLWLSPPSWHSELPLPPLVSYTVCLLVFEDRMIISHIWTEKAVNVLYRKDVGDLSRERERKSASGEISASKEWDRIKGTRIEPLSQHIWPSGPATRLKASYIACSLWESSDSSYCQHSTLHISITPSLSHTCENRLLQFWFHLTDQHCDCGKGLRWNAWNNHHHY